MQHLNHLQVMDSAADEEFHRSPGGTVRLRTVNRNRHGEAVLGQLQQSIDAADLERQSVDIGMDELRAMGTVVVLEGANAAYPLKLESLEQYTRHRKTPALPKWLLLSVRAAEEGAPERATVWISDEHRGEFLGLFEEYLQRETPAGKPKNQALVANISRIRRAVMEDLWTSEGDPPMQGRYWWEVWLEASPSAIDDLMSFAESREMAMIPRALLFRDRHVVWLEATWRQLELLPFTRVPLAEVRRPSFVDTIDDLSASEQDEYVRDLSDRVTHATGMEAPTVCHLDTGVFRGHVLLRSSLAEEDVHTVLGTSGADVEGHGTSMAGLALFGDLDPLLIGTTAVQLTHRLESVRMVPGRGETPHDPLDFGTATATAVSLPEATAAHRPRVFCLPLSTAPDKPGEPTLWSATVDALACGTAIARDGQRLRLLTAPDPAVTRLIIVAAGNVNRYSADHLAESDTSAIEDPAQAWNALTVGASTEMAVLPSDPSYRGWVALAPPGELSPHSRTSLLFPGRSFPIKPDICMEGGNVLHDGLSDFEDRHPMLSLRSTGTGNDLSTTTANATSAASAQAARLAAMAMARYPSYWPETVRGLLTHSAEWTTPMRSGIDAASTRGSKLALLRRYGWGVPDADRVLGSSRQAVTLVAQDSFIPFEGTEHTMRHFRLHELPWPSEALEQIGDDEVRVRITLSYFIEPSPSRRGWRRRYAYASHGLRFDLQGPRETQDAFVRRTNREAQLDEDGTPSDDTNGRWLIGPTARHLGSLHQDEWTSTGYELSQCKAVAVYPVGGWWKNNRRSDRISRPVRYSLLISLRTDLVGIDLYTPIASQIGLPTPTPIVVE